MKKIISMLLMLCLVMGLCGMSAFAEIPDDLPIADVIELDVNSLPGSGAPELTYAYQFSVSEVSKNNDEQIQRYGDWYVDYVLSFDDAITLNCNTYQDENGADGFLAGQYEAWSENWVSVPFEDVTVDSNGLKIMEYAASLLSQSGLKVTYNDILGVDTFRCGVFLNPDVADTGITLQLRVYNPNDSSESYSIGNAIRITTSNPAPAVSNTYAVPATADNSNMPLWGLLFIGFAAVAVLTGKKRRA